MIFGWLQRPYLIGAVLALLVLSVACQIAIGILYQRMLRETDNMAETGDQILKQCKLKFSNCYELNGGCVNIPVFVDKFMNQRKVAGLRPDSMAHASGQLLLLSVFLAGIGACADIIGGGSLPEILPYYIVSLFGLYLYFSISALVDARGKRAAVRTNLIDYLENHLVKRLQLVREKEMQPFLPRKTAGGADGRSAEAEPFMESERAGEPSVEAERSERTKRFLDEKSEHGARKESADGDRAFAAEAENRKAGREEEGDELETLLREFFA